MAPPPEGAICHRNIDSGNSQCVFISTRLLEERFAIAFEFYINVGHAFVDKAGISPEFGGAGVVTGSQAMSAGKPVLTRMNFASRPALWLRPRGRKSQVRLSGRGIF